MDSIEAVRLKERYEEEVGYSVSFQREYQEEYYFNLQYHH